MFEVCGVGNCGHLIKPARGRQVKKQALAGSGFFGKLSAMAHFTAIPGGGVGKLRRLFGTKPPARQPGALFCLNTG
jgi:hypothetical protein